MAAQLTMGKSMAFRRANLTKALLPAGVGYLDLGDDLIIVEDGCLGHGYLEEVLCLDGPPGCLYGGIEGDQGRSRIAGMDRIAALLHAAAEDGVIPVVSVDGIAPSAAFSEAGKAVVLVTVVPAPDILADVAADRAHLPQVGGGGPARGLCQGRVRIHDSRCRWRYPRVASGRR